MRTLGKDLVFGSDNVARDAATVIFASDVVVGSSGRPSFHEYAFGFSETEGRAWVTRLDVLGSNEIPRHLQLARRLRDDDVPGCDARLNDELTIARVA